MTTLEPLFSTRDLAKSTGLQQSSIGRLANQHKIGRRIGWGWIFTQAEVDQLTKLAQSGPGNPDWIASKKPVAPA